MLHIITLGHDLGKATRYFQEYLATKKKNNLTHHALLSALYCYDAACKEIDDPLLRLAAFLLPKRHHSDLINFIDDLAIGDRELLAKQIDSIDPQEWERLCQEIDYRFNRNLDLTALVHQLKRDRKTLRQDFAIERFFEVVLLYSLLLDSDKSDAADIQEPLCKLPDPTIIERFIEHLPSKKPIDTLRKEAFKAVKRSNPTQDILTLNLPTGIGKTLLALYLALRSGKSRIIYALPFLSIIEQNFEVLQEVLRFNNIQPTSTLALKHHHLSHYRYDEYDFEASRLLTEGWHSAIVVTTFMQFFHTLIGYKNRDLRRFHQLRQSFIILDEPQTLPHRYWHLFEKMLTTLTKEFDAQVLLVTATKPLIFQKSQELVEPKSFFVHLNRYKLLVDLTPKRIDELTPKRDTLFVLNTIKSAQLLYQNIDMKKCFLSTHIPPKERLRRIKRLGEYEAVVSTQLIEAGVDIDFKHIVRDFAPLDSIIQSAGRCNRHSTFTQGKVELIYLVDENEKAYCRYIYDSLLLDITKSLFRKESYEEKELWELSKHYYELLRNRKSDQNSKELLEAVQRFRFSSSEKSSIDKFRLIQEEPYKRDVFIELDEEAQKIWQAYKELRKLKEPKERYEAFLKIKNSFYAYVISVPIEENTPPIEEDFYYVSQKELDEYYDQETGYKLQRLYYVY